MTGNPESLPRWPLSVAFYVDECLPPQIAEALALVDYPITHPSAHGRLGEKDELLLPWLGEQGYVWVTRDDAAKKAHRSLFIEHNVSALWVRGMDRKKANPLGVHDLFLMLASKLERVAERVAAAKGPLHSMVHMKSGGGFVLERIDIYKITPEKHLPSIGKLSG